MASDSVVVGAAEQAGRNPRPYAPSWLDRLYVVLADLPGPTWLAYVLLVIPSGLISTSALWVSGLLPVGQLNPIQAFWGLATVGLLAASHRLKVVAGASFDGFRPALGTGIADPDRARYELTVMPSRAIVVVTVVSFVVTPLYYVADPVAAQVVGLTPIGLVPRIISEGFTSTVLLAILYQAVRQMRIVGRLHDAADRVDPFRPAPLYAFSRLTAQAGIVLIAFNAVGGVLLLANSEVVESTSVIALFAPWFIGFSLAAIAIFVVPLLGMHHRLEAEKDRVEGAADGRMRDLLGELNEAIDARATDRVEALDRTISALRHEREILAKLPTWPWSASTIRGFGSALLLPITVFLLQRVLLEILPA